MIEKIIRIHDIEYRVTGGIKIPPYTDALYEIEENGIRHYEKTRWNEIMDKKIVNVYFILEETNLKTTGI